MAGDEGPLTERQMDQAPQCVAGCWRQLLSPWSHPLPAPTPCAGPDSSRVPTGTSFPHGHSTGEQPFNLSRGRQLEIVGHWAAEGTGRQRWEGESGMDRTQRPQGPEAAMFAGGPEREDVVPMGFPVSGLAWTGGLSDHRSGPVASVILFCCSPLCQAVLSCRGTPHGRMLPTFPWKL